MKISRQVGTVSEVLNIFINDVTVSTGAGLANVIASSVSFGWMRNNQTAVSSGSCSSGGTLGTYSVSSLTQASSTLALGWYQFGVPNGIFTSGRSALLHLYGAPNMVPVPIEIELTGLDNQTALSAQAVSTVSGGVRVSSSVTVGVSSIVTVGVSSFGGITVGVSSVTDKTGYSGSVNVSAFALPVGVSSFTLPVGVSSLATNVIVSTAISSQALAGKGDWAVSSGVRVTSISIPVGVSTGSVNVSAFALPVGVSSGTWLAGVSTVTDKTGYSGSVNVSAFALPVGVSSFGITVGVSTAVLLDASYGPAGSISTNVVQMNSVPVIGTGVSSDLWRA